MKKIFAIILCLAAVLSLTACGKDEEKFLWNDGAGYEEWDDYEDSEDYNIGLEKTVDPFADVSLWVFGQSGHGQVNEASAFIKDAEGKTHRYVLEHDTSKNKSLSNGDQIWVKFKEDYPMEKREEDLGVKLSRSEAVVTVYGFYDPSCKELGEKATVNLNDYVTYGSSGSYDGVGYAYVDIDYPKILRDHVMSLNVGVEEEAMLGSSCPWGTVSSIFFDSSDCPILPKTEGRGDYKNGDTAHITWEVDQEELAVLKKLMNVDFVYSDFSFTVEGLPALTEVDPFEYCEITYEGTNGEATARAMICIETETGTFRLPLDEIAENNGHLSNGDTLVINIASYVDMFLDDALVPTRTEYEVIVSGLM